MKTIKRWQLIGSEFWGLVRDKPIENIILSMRLPPEFAKAVKPKHIIRNRIFDMLILRTADTSN